MNDMQKIKISEMNNRNRTETERVRYPGAGKNERRFLYVRRTVCQTGSQGHGVS